MRKYVFGTGIIGAIFGVIPAIRATREQERNWRLILIWGSWAITAALAVTAIVDAARGIEIDKD